MILLICLHINSEGVYGLRGGRDIQGLEQAVDFVIGDQDCVSVLYDGYFYGKFTFFMRARDKDRRIFVFRASKIIFAVKWLVEWGYFELVRDISEFYDILDRYSIKYIVQEEEDVLATAANKKLRQWVQGPGFKLIQRYDVSCSGMDGFGDLLVYEYLDYKAKPISHIEFEMPSLGRRVSVDLKGKKSVGD